MIIYKTINTVNGKIYVGQDSKNNPKYLGSGTLLKLAIKKYKRKSFIKEVLEVIEDIDKVGEREEYWISKLDARNRDVGYNIAHGGKNFMFGVKFTESHRKKIGDGHRGKVLGPLSDEQKKKLSDILTGRKFTEIHRQRLTEANRRQVKTEAQRYRLVEYQRKFGYTKEHQAKMVEAARVATIKTIYKYSKDGLFIEQYESMSAAAKIYGVHTSCLSDACNGKQKTCKGFLWSYLEPIDNRLPKPEHDEVVYHG